MNKKIEELLLQCSNGEYVDYKKFAELIVQECIGIVEKQKTKMSYGPTLLIEDIKQHFGVEDRC